MKQIEVTIGYRIEDYFSWENGFPRIDTKYVGGKTDNGICYKDLDAWERGGYDDVIYISECDLEEPIHNNCCRWTKPSWLAWVKDTCECEGIPTDDDFIEYIAKCILHECDWQDLSTMLEEIDLYENFVEFNKK